MSFNSSNVVFIGYLRSITLSTFIFSIRNSRYSWCFHYLYSKNIANERKVWRYQRGNQIL